MKKYTFKIFVAATLLFFSVPIRAFQQLSVQKTPPETPQEFLKKLGELVTLDKQETSAKAFDAFEKKFKSNGFSEREQQRIMTTCNSMRDARLGAQPYFVDYIRSATGAESGSTSTEKETSRFEQWHECFDGVFSEFLKTRKFEPIKRFLNFSTDFMGSNSLFLEYNAITWQADNRDYVWKFENNTPSVTWKKVKLTASFKKDSIEIKDTKGSFFPAVNQWVGSNAKVTWERFKNNDIACELSNYTIDMSKGFYHADSAKLHYPALLESDVTGSFDDKVNFSKSGNEDTYPRFESFEKRLKINNIGKNIGYEGGFRLYGLTVYGYGTKEQRAHLTVANGKTGERALRSAALQFAIRKGESVLSETAETAIYFGKDSIYHPSVNFQLDIGKNVLQLTRGTRASQRNPFFDSYHHVNMDMGKIKWLFDNDSLILGDRNPGYSVNAKNALFESFEYFSENDYEKFQNIATRNPLTVLKMYAQKVDKRKLNADEAMQQINAKMDASMVQSLISDMVAGGFINYDPEKNEIELKDKIFHYSLANQKKVDYDVLRFKSETKDENAFFTLKDTIIKINGVKSVELSAKQRIRIIPRGDEVRLKHNRDFDFDGRIYAGYGVMHGKQHHFNYAPFEIQMDSLRYLDLYLKTGQDAYKRPIASAINSRIEHLRGVLLIDAPSNKSGREDIKMFPSFQSKDNSYVFYDAKETQDSTYKRDSFYFKLDRFNLDNLDSLTRQQLNFKGTMVSARIFPDFKETLTLQPDSSLGFVNRSTEGYAAYDGKGNFKGEVALNNKGFTGKGLLSYLDAKINSKDIIFRPKQTTASAESFDMAENRSRNVPKITAPGVQINWIPQRDSMYLTVRGDTSFKFFPEGDYKMRKTIIVTPSGVKGIGDFEWEKGLLRSKQFAFNSHQVAADTMQLSIKVLNKAFSEQLALDTKNLKGDIDFDKKIGKFKSNSDREFTVMPGIKYKTTVNEFQWLLDDELIQFLPRGEALFACTDPDQENLDFLGQKATYDLKVNNLKVGGVDHITSCDAYIYPNEQKTQIELGGKMSTLENARIECDTVTKHHVIKRATVNIKGRKNYTAIGFYEYNIAGREQEIKFDNIIGQRVGKGSMSEKRTETQATGTVSANDTFLIDQKTTFKGTISLFSASKNLRFEGFAKLMHENLPDHQWFTVNSLSDKSDLALRYSAPKNEDGEPLHTGIFLSKENSEAYPRVMMPLHYRKDRPIIDFKGVFKYKNLTDELVFGDSSRVFETDNRGNKLVYDNRTGYINADGKLMLGTGLTSMKLLAAGRAKTNFQSPSEAASDSNGVKGSLLTLEAMIGIDMHVPDKLLKIMAADVQVGTFDAPDADYRKDDFTEKALLEFVKEDKDYNKVVGEMKSRLLTIPDKYNKFSFLIGRATLRWNPELQSFVSYGTKTDIQSILGININKKMTTLLEFKMPANEDDRVYIYVKTANDMLYFFGYQKGILEMVSTNPRFEEEFNKIKPKERVKKNEDGTVIEFAWGELAKAEMFVKRVQNAQGK
jgi:hypothetical protein